MFPASERYVPQGYHDARYGRVDGSCPWAARARRNRIWAMPITDQTMKVATTLGLDGVSYEEEGRTHRLML